MKQYATEWFEEGVFDSNIHLSSEQETAVDMCCDLTELIVGVTGGAGVGKTLVLGHVCRELRRRNKRVVLCAPTGRAAKRIQEMTQIPAKTIHRLLEFPLPMEEGDPNFPRRTIQNPLEEDVIIVDEASMINEELYRFLLNATPRGSVVRFFGDNNQLPPVEGDDEPPFIRILRERPSMELTYNYRSDDALLGNADRILRGSIPVRNAQFEIIYSDDPVRELLRITDSHFKQEDHQIITPTRRGIVGTTKINPRLQMELNPSGQVLRLDRFDNKKESPIPIRANDKFLWIKNDYHMNMFNGEIGKVNWVDPEDGSLELAMGQDTRIIPARAKVYSTMEGRVIPYDPRKQIELGYAVTTHKAQGSEFNCVIYMMCRAQAWMLDRRNFYTGVTRAKKHVIVITDRAAMTYSMKRHKVDRMLRDRQIGW